MKLSYRFALALIAILLVTVVLAPVSGSTRWMRTLQDSAHGPVFGCIALLALGILRTRPRFESQAPWRQYLIALGVAALLGVASELAQIPVGRDASFADVRHDLLGALAFLAVASVFDRRLHRAAQRHVARVGIFLVAACALGVLAAPMARAVVEYQRRDASFPVIADFSHRFDRYFVSQNVTAIEAAGLPPPWSTRANESAMRVTFLAGAYPGIDFFELLPDWSAYSTLALDLTNPTSSPLVLTLLVLDADHDYELEDRYTGSVIVPASTRRVTRVALADIEAGPPQRRIDLRRIDRVVLFRDQACEAGEMYVSRVWLE